MMINVALDEGVIEKMYDARVNRADDLPVDIKLARGDVAEDIPVAADVETGAQNVTFKPGIKFDMACGDERTAQDARGCNFEHG